MIERVSKTFQSDGSIDVGKKMITYNQQRVEVDIKYLWVADISDLSNNNYGIASLKTDIGLFGTYIVPQYHLSNDETEYSVVKYDDHIDYLHNSLSSTTLFPSTFEISWGSGIRCKIYILTPAMSTYLYFYSGLKQDPMIETLWKAIEATQSRLFNAHDEEQKIFIRQNLFGKYKR